MKKAEKLIVICIISILVFICLFFVPRMSIFRLKSDLYNAEADKIHFLKDDDRNGGDAIIIESNGHYGLIDAMNPGLTSTIDTSFNYQYDNGTKVKNYLMQLGCYHLDFVIMTHSHSDHIGGIPELGELVNYDTKVFYKEDLTSTDDIEDDNCGNSSNCKYWHNHEYYEAAMNYFNYWNAKLCNLENMPNDCGATYDSNDSFAYDTNLKHNYSFTMGDFNIKLYNIHNITYHFENLNSIATVVTHIPSGKKAALLGDQETARNDLDKYEKDNTTDYNPSLHPTSTKENPVGTCNECLNKGLENQLSDIIGEVDILKANHHSSTTSNSYYMLNNFKPKYYVITSAQTLTSNATYLRESSTASIFYMDKKFGTLSYYTNNAQGAIAFEFTNDIGVYNYAINGTRIDTMLPALKNAQEDWYYMNNTNNRNKKWVYIKNCDLTIGWFNDGTDDYYFNNDGIMLTGVQHISYNDVPGYYYFNSTGKMQTSWITTNNKTYYFRTVKNEISTGYKGSAVTGWATISNKDYYFNDNGVRLEGIHYLTYNNVPGYYYFSLDDEYKGQMQTNWKKVDNNWYYFRTKRDDISSGYKGSAVTGWAEIKETEGDNYYKYYFRTSENDITTGPAAAMVKGLATINNKTYYFRNSKNEVTTGPEGSMVKDACLVIDNNQYCFDSNGELIDDDIDISNLTIINNVVILRKNSTLDTIFEIIGKTSNKVKVYDGEDELAHDTRLKTNNTLKVKETPYPIAILGDVKADGIVNSNDVGRAYRITGQISQLSTLTDAEKQALDYNSDGYYNLLDVNNIYSQIN